MRKKIFCLFIFTFVLSPSFGSSKQIETETTVLSKTLREVEVGSATSNKIQISFITEEGKRKSSLLFGIPDVALGAFIGSLIAALSAGWTLWYTTKSSRRLQEDRFNHEQVLQREKLKCDVEQKVIDRKNDIRKEVYLELVVKVGEGLTYLSTLPTSNIDADYNPQPYTDLLIALNKVALVGDIDTQAAAHKALAVIGTYFFKQITWKQKFVELQKQIDAEPRNEKLLELRTRHKKEYIHSVVVDAAPLRDAQAHLIAQIKNDLGIKSDVEALKKEYEEVAMAAMQNIEKLFP